LLKEYKKGVMQKIFSQELRFKDENGEEFPKWEEKKLGDLGTFFSGGTPLTTKRQYFNGNIPFIRSGELNAKITEQYISEEGLKNSSSKMVEIGDLIYALYGATSGEVAISKIKGAINQAILCIRTSLDNTFLLNYLILNKENIINTYLQGGQGNLSAEIIKSLIVPAPKLKEQTKIANFLSAIDEKINQCGVQIEKMEGWKKGLLQKMFV
ncbi:MAG: restriction endonuclease subunit S, partial [Paludibacter sp.]|nr:restriction endonuclease subunit S [Paludibacter sp.]